jgi:hypothetical protein
LNFLILRASAVSFGEEPAGGIGAVLAAIQHPLMVQARAKEPTDVLRLTRAKSDSASVRVNELPAMFRRLVDHEQTDHT